MTYLNFLNKMFEILKTFYFNLKIEIKKMKNKIL